MILSSGVSITAAADGEIGGCAREKTGRERSGFKLPGTIKIEIWRLAGYKTTVRGLTGGHNQLSLKPLLPTSRE